MANERLFRPVNEHGIELKNAIVMAPMTRSRAIGSVPNNLMVEYYRQRSEAGLIITEGNAPSINGLGYARTPGIFTKAQIEGWKKITEAVHEKGGKIFTQLMHVGRISHSANTPDGARILAPSPIASKGELWTDSLGLQPKGQPDEMTTEDIENTIEEFLQASVNALQSGFDGVELHGANGYILEQFLNPNSNQRTDAYGGTVANRSRFILELTRAVGSVIGTDKVGIRLSPYGTFNDMPVYSEIFETYDHLTRELSKLQILYIHLIDFAARTTDEGRELIGRTRKNFDKLLILNGGYNKERAEQALADGEADLISFGSPFIANPDLPLRMRNNHPINPPDQNTLYTAGAEGYTDYDFVKLQSA